MKDVIPSNHNWPLAAIAGVLLTSCGCSSESPLYPVSGKILYKGQPATGARVTFYPKDNPDPQALHPTGIVEVDGTFTLTSREPDDGAPVGEYVVTVIWPDTSPTASDGFKQHLHDRLKGAYSNPGKSSLHAKVVKGVNELPPFDLQ